VVLGGRALRMAHRSSPWMAIRTDRSMIEDGELFPSEEA